MLDPNDFVITRKRKKYKFAKFANSPLCYEYDEYRSQPHRAVHTLEVGAGTGLFSVAMAMNHPKQQFVALDVKGDRLQTGAYQAMARGAENLSFVRARADQLGDLFTAPLQAIWLTFPDPFPKRSSAGRRLTHQHFLAIYACILQPGGALYFKHDDPAFFAWSLEQLVAAGWRISELSFDLHDSPLSDEYKRSTTYEQRWRDQGRVIHFAKAIRPEIITLEKEKYETK